MFVTVIRACVFLIVAIPVLADDPGETGIEGRWELPQGDFVEVPGRRRYVMHSAGLIDLLQNPKVQQELQCSQQQKTRISNILADLNTRGPAFDRAEIFKMDQAARIEFMRKRYRERIEANDATVNELLKGLNPEQITRLRQISIQVSGLQCALCVPSPENKKLFPEGKKLADQIKLSKEQRAKIIASSRNFFSTRQDLIDELKTGALSGDKACEAVEESELEAEQTARDVLTEEQKTLIGRMMGKPFDLPPPTQRIQLNSSFQIEFRRLMAMRPPFQMVLLRHPKIQTELNVSQAQKKQIEEIFEMHIDQVLSTSTKPKLQDRRQSAQVRDTRFQRMIDALNPDQKKRLREISIQLSGVKAFDDDAVAKQLELTQAQRSRVNAIYARVLNTMYKVAADKILNEAELEMDKVLTEKQRIAFGKMKGEKFNVSDFDFMQVPMQP